MAISSMTWRKTASELAARPSGRRHGSGRGLQSRPRGRRLEWCKGPGSRRRSPSQPNSWDLGVARRAEASPLFVDDQVVGADEVAVARDQRLPTGRAVG